MSYFKPGEYDEEHGPQHVSKRKKEANKSMHKAMGLGSKKKEVAKKMKKDSKGLVGNSHLDNYGVNSPAMKASPYYKGEFKKK